MKYFLSRFMEPSTWAGLAALASIFGVPATTAEAVTKAVVAVAGAVAVVAPEKSAGQ